jgi:glycosyltransferase involved in cell wall biosynthesis
MEFLVKIIIILIVCIIRLKPNINTKKLSKKRIKSGINMDKFGSEELILNTSESLKNSSNLDNFELKQQKVVNNKSIFVIDCQPLQHEIRGIGRYGVNLVNTLLENYSNIFSFHLIINNFLGDDLINRINQEKGIIHKVNFENVIEPNYHERNVDYSPNESKHEKKLANYINYLKPNYFLNLSEFDRLHVMINIDLLDNNIQTFSILYDLIPLKNGWLNSFSKIVNSKWKETYEKQIQNLKKYDKLLSISEFTKKDCSDVFNNIENIGTGVTDYTYSFTKQHEKSVLIKFNIDKKYIYCQSSFGPNKGFSFLCEQYSKLPGDIKKDLLLVFGSDIPEDYVKQNMNNKNVIITGYLSEEDLHILHENAWLFVFPSTYEGFGIPPVEAMKHNKPVIVANNTSLVEVIGNDKFMFNHDEKSCSDLITNLYNDPNLYNECIKNSTERKDLFSWNIVTYKLLSIIKIKISIILVLHNNLEWFDYFENKINIMREKYNFDFDFYIYENNSNIEFKKRLENFMASSKGKLLSENTNSNKFESIISKERGEYMNNIRNKNKLNHGHLNSEYSWLIDSDVYFDDDILVKYINNLKDDISLCAISSLCFCEKTHYYDSLAFMTDKYNYKNTCNTCLMSNCDICKNHRLNYSTPSIVIPEEDLIVPGSIIYPECAFGSNTLVNTEIYNKVEWTTEYGFEETDWFGFFKNIRKYGRIAMDTKIISHKNK